MEQEDSICHGFMYRTLACQCYMLFKICHILKAKQSTCPHPNIELLTLCMRQWENSTTELLSSEFRNGFSNYYWVSYHVSCWIVRKSILNVYFKMVLNSNTVLYEKL